MVWIVIMYDCHSPPPKPEPSERRMVYHAPYGTCTCVCNVSCLAQVMQGGCPIKNGIAPPVPPFSSPIHSSFLSRPLARRQQATCVLTLTNAPVQFPPTGAPISRIEFNPFNGLIRWWLIGFCIYTCAHMMMNWKGGVPSVMVRGYV